MKRFKVLVSILLALLLAAPAVHAQSYPNRPITLVIPYAAGTGIDNFGRAISTALSRSLGHPVVVENRPGAGTNIGAMHVVRSKPDGYTLLLGANAALAANVSLYNQTGFDPTADLTPVAFLGKGAMVVLTNPSTGVSTMSELIRLAKDDPRKLNFGAANTTARVWIELIKSMTGIPGETVNYANAGNMLNDLVGGQVGFAVENTGTSRALISSKKLVPIAVTSKVRGKFNANVPTLTEAGYGNYEVDTWYAVVAPKGLPPELVKKLNTEINAALKQDDVLRAADLLELTGGGGTPQELAAFQATEIAKWRDLVQRTGIRLD